ncbi:MAG: NAD-dependent epimerase/dehydratase family protein [Bacteroidetes bacterium]|nr:NAD-dependent epimerase/dehydratase family protein [Bacteroidota bacterium]
MTKKILLTGGTGFLGSYILALLVHQGYTVHALRRGSTVPHWIDPALMDKVQWINGDVLDIVGLEEAMENIDAVIHAAAMVSFASSERKELYQTNVEGTANVVNACLEKKVKRLVHISSVAALGRKVGGGHVDETAKWEENPLQTHYARSKYKAELHVWRGHCEGLDTVILNPSTILGFGDWTKSSCAIFKQMHDGFKWYTPGLNGFVDVQDVAKATLLLLEEGKNGQRYVINGDTWPFQQLQEQIAKSFIKPAPRLKANAFILGLAWRIEAFRSLITGKKPLLTKESARVAQSKTMFDNQKLLSAFPSFQYTPLVKTIEQACARYSQYYA